MNFLSALFNINTLRKENARLQNVNTELALHNLKLVSQTESMKDQFLTQDNAIRTLHREVQSLRDKLAQHSGAKQAKSEPAKMKAASPVQTKAQGFTATPVSASNAKRRGRKPKNAN